MTARHTHTLATACILAALTLAAAPPAQAGTIFNPSDPTYRAAVVLPEVEVFNNTPDTYYRSLSPLTVSWPTEHQVVGQFALLFRQELPPEIAPDTPPLVHLIYYTDDGGYFTGVATIRPSTFHPDYPWEAIWTVYRDTSFLRSAWVFGTYPGAYMAVAQRIEAQWNPEPASIGLLAVGGLAVLRRRRG